VIDTSASKFAKPVRKKRRNRVRSKRTLKLAKMKWELDRIAKAQVFERDGHKCIRCGATNRQLQPAHVLSRTHLCLRWEPENLMSLCGGCHLAWHHEPAMAVEWFTKTYSDRWFRIKNVLMVNPKVSVKELWEARVMTAEPQP
jgi:5-methylcytosine-specific restriction endonuclease McrA